mgnify:CR=1 FL=1
MKTQYFTATSLDGFLATEDDSLDWLFPLGDVNDTSYPDFIAQVGALAMGAATYLWMVRNAQTVAAQTGSPWPYEQPTWVFSHRTLPLIEGADIRFVQGDVRPVHAEMVRAAGTRNIWIVGGGDLAAQFFDAGLLDEAVIQVAMLADSSIDIAIRPWVPVLEYGAAMGDVNAAVLEAFRARGIDMPFPQREVRLVGGPGATDARIVGASQAPGR